MKYLYYDLGEQLEDTEVVAHLRGSTANVILVDPVNFDRYRLGLPFLYTGGFCGRTPARLQIPREGHWYLVIDCGGYRHGVCVDSVEVTAPNETPAAAQPDTTLVGANAS